MYVNKIKPNNNLKYANKIWNFGSMYHETNFLLLLFLKYYYKLKYVYLKCYFYNKKDAYIIKSLPC